MSITAINGITLNGVQSKEGNALSQINDLSEKVWRVAQATFFTIEIFFDPVVDFFTQGLSDFLGLETLRHGTSIQNYISIRLNGADPTFGGKDKGVIEGLEGIGVGLSGQYKEVNPRNKAKGYFFVAKDSEAYVSFFGTFGSQLFNRCISSRAYCGMSAMATVSGTRIHKILLKIVIVAFNVIFVPTVKFRFLLEDIPGRFENDPDNACDRDHRKGLAYMTKIPISTDHIGLKGVLKQGLRGDIWARMKAHPVKVCWGLVKLINPIGIVILLALGICLSVRKSCNFLQRNTQVVSNYSNY